MGPKHDQLPELPRKFLLEISWINIYRDKSQESALKKKIAGDESVDGSSLRITKMWEGIMSSSWYLESRAVKICGWPHKTKTAS